VGATDGGTKGLFLRDLDFGHQFKSVVPIFRKTAEDGVPSFVAAQRWASPSFSMMELDHGLSGQPQSVERRQNGDR
jgi:hypothetical protein